VDGTHRWDDEQIALTHAIAHYDRLIELTKDQCPHTRYHHSFIGTVNAPVAHGVYHVVTEKSAERRVQRRPSARIGHHFPMSNFTAVTPEAMAMRAHAAITHSQNSHYGRYESAHHHRMLSSSPTH